MSFMFCFCITLETRVDYMRLKYEPSWEPLHISAKQLFSDQVLLKTAITGLSFRKNNITSLRYQGSDELVLPILHACCRDAFFL